MRLEPIEKPRNLILKVVYGLIRKKFGKVVTPMKVIYARKPTLLAVFLLINLLDKNKIFSPSFRLLLQTHISLLNGCDFCQDARQALAVQRHIGIDKFQALHEYRVSPLFDQRERVALSFLEECSMNKQVHDVTFADLRTHFTEAEIIELIWMNAAENYFNSLAVPLNIRTDGLRRLAQERAGGRKRKGSNTIAPG